LHNFPGAIRRKNIPLFTEKKIKVFLLTINWLTPKNIPKISHFYPQAEILPSPHKLGIKFHISNFDFEISVKGMVKDNAKMNKIPTFLISDLAWNACLEQLVGLKFFGGKLYF
jgi:hypothetical protein